MGRGSEALGKLLWSCYRNGIHTSGCDAGNHHFPYLAFYLDSGIESVKRLITATWNYGASELFLTFAGNPYSGPEWHKTKLSVKPLNNKCANDFFETLANTLDEKQIENTGQGFLDILKLSELLEESGDDIAVRMTKNGNQYRLSINCFKSKRNWQYWTALFEEAGLHLINSKKKDSPFIYWEYTSSNQEAFEKCISKLLVVLQTKHSLKLPDEISEDMSFSTKALVMRRKFGFDENGIKLMNKWLEENKT